MCNSVSTLPRLCRHGACGCAASSDHPLGLPVAAGDAHSSLGDFCPWLPKAPCSMHPHSSPSRALPAGLPTSTPCRVLPTFQRAAEVRSLVSAASRPGACSSMHLPTILGKFLGVSELPGPPLRDGITAREPPLGLGQAVSQETGGVQGQEDLGERLRSTPFWELDLEQQTAPSCSSWVSGDNWAADFHERSAELCDCPRPARSKMPGEGRCTLLGTALQDTAPALRRTGRRCLGSFLPLPWQGQHPPPPAGWHWGSICPWGISVPGPTLGGPQEVAEAPGSSACPAGFK